MMTVCAILMSCDKNEILIETPSARGTMTDNDLLFQKMKLRG